MRPEGRQRVQTDGHWERTGLEEKTRGGDVEMVPGLTPSQVEDLHKDRIRAAADKFRHLRTLAAKEMEGVEEGARQELPQQRPPEDSPTGAKAAGQQQQRGGGGEAGGGGQREAATGGAARGPPQREAASEGLRPQAQCIGRWQSAEERDMERGRWRAGGSGARGRSTVPRAGAEGARARSGQRSEDRRCSRTAAPVTPVDPLVAMEVTEEIGRTRDEIASRMERVVLQVETNAAAELVKRNVEVRAAITAQERMQLLQEVEFAAACSRRATEDGLQTPQQREQVRRLWIEQMASVGEGHLAEAAFATYGPTGMPLDEQQRALRGAIRRANLGEVAARRYVSVGGKVEGADDSRGQPHGQSSADEAGDGGRSR